MRFSLHALQSREDTASVIWVSREKTVVSVSHSTV